MKGGRQLSGFRSSVLKAISATFSKTVAWYAASSGSFPHVNGP